MFLTKIPRDFTCVIKCGFGTCEYFTLHMILEDVNISHVRPHLILEHENISHVIEWDMCSNMLKMDHLTGRWIYSRPDVDYPIIIIWEVEFVR